MKNTDTTKKIVQQTEKTIKDFVSRNPITSFLGSFCVGVAVGAADEQLQGSERIKNFGKQMFQNHGQEILERAFDGALGTQLFRAGLTTLAEHFTPMRSQVRENPASSQRSKSFN